MDGTDLQLNKSVTNSDAVANGGRQSYNVVSSNVLNNLFPNVSQADRTAGLTRYRKFFFRNKNAADETAANSRMWISLKSTGGDYFRIKAGTDIDTQAEADDYVDWLGTGHLTSVLATDATTIEALFDTNDGIYNGSLIRLSDSSGGEEFLTIKSSGGVTWLGNAVTILTTSGARSTYPASQNSLLSGVVDLGNLVPSLNSWAETSASGTYDEVTYPLTLNNIGTVSDDWTLTFTGASTFIVSGANTGSIGTGSISSNFSPVNANAGGGAYYFSLNASGFGGTWQSGDTITFSTVHSSGGVWVRETVPAGTAAKTSNTFHVTLYCEGS